MRSRNAQLSLELLLLLAVLFSFLLALSPVISKTRDAAELAASSQAGKIALESIATTARQAYLLGSGSQLQARVSFKTPVELASEPPSLELRFSAGGVNKTLLSQLGFELALGQTSFEKGEYDVRVENNGGIVGASFSRVEAQP